MTAVDCAAAPRTSRSSVTWVLMLLIAGLGGCMTTVKKPVQQSTVVVQPPGVATEVGLPLAYSGSFFARIGDVDYTARFAIDLATRTATARLPLAPGAYRLDVGACWAWTIPFPAFLPWPTWSGCPTASADFTVILPKLLLAPPAGALVVGGTATATVASDVAPDAALSPTLATSPTGRIGAPPTVAIGAGATAPVTVSLQGLAPGSATLTATAAGWQSATLAMHVLPRLDAITPSRGSTGTAIALTGAGFVNPTVRFGTSAPIAATATAGGTRIDTTVPAGLMPESTLVTVTSALETSAGIAFDVGDPVVFRSTEQQIEVVRFSPAVPFSSSTLSLVGTPVGATMSPGNLSVGLVSDGIVLTRASANGAQRFSIGGSANAPTLALSGATGLASGLTGTGTAAALLPGMLLRGTTTGVDALASSGSPIGKLGSGSGDMSSVGVALLSDAASQRAWRSTASGLEVWNLATPATPVRLPGNVANITGSGTGTALAWMTPGARLVRATNLGVDIIDTTTAPPTLMGSKNTGGGSALGVAVAVTGNRAVRATSFGIEVWDISVPGMPRQCSFRNNDLSGTGVGVVVIGTAAIRATNLSIEAYDISDTSCPNTPSGTIIPAPVVLRTGLGQSATGVALVRF